MEAVTEILMDIGSLKKQLQERGGQLTPDFKVVFENPVRVYARNGAAGGITEPDQELEIGFADISFEGDKVVGQISLLPHLQEFYDRNPRFKPRYTAIGAISTNGTTIDSIVVQWIGAQ